MGYFIIGYGLSGGFGGIRDYEVIEADSQDEASEIAYESACEYYEGYVGNYGLRDIQDIIYEDNVDEEEAEYIFEEEREGWLDYIAEPYSKEYERKVSGHHYHNPFKNELGDVEN